MIPKNNLEQYIAHNKDYENLINRVEDVLTNVLRLNSFKILFFVSAKEQQIINDCLNHFSNANCVFVSKIINSETKAALFYYDNIDITDIDVTTLYKIKFNSKFLDVNHRDVLGSLMSLNISREYIGDIFVQDNYIYFELLSSLDRYLQENLTKIKRINVKLEKVTETIEKKQDFAEFRGIVKSYRLDNIVKLITKQSNQQAKDYILANNVKINQINTNNFSKVCLDGDILSLKGYGRFKLEINHKETKKGNHIINYFKYL